MSRHVFSHDDSCLQSRQYAQFLGLHKCGYFSITDICYQALAIEQDAIKEAARAG
ncbi:MAG: hypothetical protein ACRCWP_05335 [Shewanella sp.]